MEENSFPSLNEIRKEAQSIKPVVIVGRNGVTENLIDSVSDAFHTREVVKVKFNDWKEEKFDLSSVIAGKTGSRIISIIGNTLILFRKITRHEDEKSSPGPENTN
jgi:RNA-binding protein